jgi:hypothetical protein
MKHLILPSLILLVACTEHEIADHTDHAVPSETSTRRKTPAPDFEGLTFGANPTNVELEWKPLSDDTDDILEKYAWKRQVVVNEITWSEDQESEKQWRDANWFFQDDGSDEYQVFQSLKTQLGTDQLKIRCTGPTGTKIRYEAECQGILYEVEYDLKTVQIIKVINTNQSPCGTEHADHDHAGPANMGR